MSYIFPERIIINGQQYVDVQVLEERLTQEEEARKSITELVCSFRIPVRSAEAADVLAAAIRECAQ